MYKVFFMLLFAVFGLAVSHPQFGIGLPKIKSFADSFSEKFYNFGFKLRDGTTREENGELINADTPQEEFVVRGRSKWFSPEGKAHRITYIADRMGYRANITEMDAKTADLEEEDRMAYKPDITEIETYKSGSEGADGSGQSRIGSGTAAALIGK
uniref:Uncharacterized protein n=1 Tax=Clastoptera arizonana TaxID=38151 RepID=A0A1B6E4I1_9HEMI